MLRLATGMRPRLRMRFATHRRWQGVHGHGVRLHYLQLARKPQPWLCRLNWQGRLWVVREGSMSSFERGMAAPVTHLIERLAERSLHAMRRGVSDWFGRPAAGLRTTQHANNTRLTGGVVRRISESLSAHVARMAWGLLQHAVFRRLLARPFGVTPAAQPIVLALWQPRLPGRHPEGIAVRRMATVPVRSVLANWLARRAKHRVARTLGRDRLAATLASLLPRRLARQQPQAFDRSPAPRAAAFFVRRLNTYREAALASVRSQAPVRDALRPARAATWRSWIVPAVHPRSAMGQGDAAVAARAWGWRHAPASGKQSLALVPVQAWRERAAAALLPRYAFTLSSRYAQAGAPAVDMVYRQAPRPRELPFSRQMQRIEQQITRKIVHDIAQASPWRGDMDKALFTPRVMRELAEQVSGMMAARTGLERYRRGL